MKIKLSGVEYDIEKGVQKASLSTLYELKVRTGIGIKTLRDMALGFRAVENPLDLLDNKDAFQTLRVLIWLARKYAGEKVGSLDDATDVALDEIELVLDDEELAAAESAGLDPKAMVGSGADVSAVDLLKSSTQTT